MSTLIRNTRGSFSSILATALAIVAFGSVNTALANNPCNQDADTACQNSPIPKTCKHAHTEGCSRLQELVDRAENEPVEREEELPYVPGTSAGEVIQNHIDISMQLLPKMINPFGSECAQPKIVGICLKKALFFCGIPWGFMVEYRKPISVVTPSRVAYQSPLLLDIDGNIQRRLFIAIMYTQAALEYFYLTDKLFLEGLKAALGVQSGQNGLLPPPPGGLDSPSLPGVGGDLDTPSLPDLGGGPSLPSIPNILSNIGGLSEGEKEGIRLARESTLRNDNLVFQNLRIQHDAPVWSHVVPTLWRFIKLWPWDCGAIKASPVDRWNSAFPENWQLLLPEGTLALGGRYQTYMQDYMQDPRSCQLAGLGDKGEFGDNTPSDALEPFGISAYQDGNYAPHCLESRTGVKVPLSPFHSWSSLHHGPRYFLGAYKGLAASCQMRPDLWYGVNAENDTDTNELVDKIEVSESLTHNAGDIADGECSDFHKFPSDLGRFNEEGNPIQPATFIHWKNFRVCVGFSDFMSGFGALTSAADMASLQSAFTGLIQQAASGGGVTEDDVDGALSDAFGGNVPAGFGGGGGCFKPCATIPPKKLVYGEGCE